MNEKKLFTAQCNAEFSSKLCHLAGSTLILILVNWQQYYFPWKTDASIRGKGIQSACFSDQAVFAVQ